MNFKKVQLSAYIVNVVMLILVFGLMAFFKMLEVDFLVKFSIPTALVYVFTTILVYKEKLNIYLWIVYFWLTLYMGITTICLGESYGFHLYCFSMIPVAYTVEYMSFRIGRKGIKSLYISIVVAVFYFIIMGYVRIKGPVYVRDNKYSLYFLVFNSLIVFGYLVVYTNFLIRSIIRSETKLINMAHKDRLTDLYNRHYMLDKLEQVVDEKQNHSVLAMADIDDFKKINDIYGHNAGDEVLKVVSQKMKDTCIGCDIARWGGEEFLILFSDDTNVIDIIEKMRSEIGSAPVEFEGKSIPVTVTVGVAPERKGRTIDEWLQVVDNKLYYGKKNGKNRVVN